MSNYPPPVSSLLKDINSFSGLNLDVNPSSIADNEATLMENFYIKENGVLSKRPGFKSIFGLGNTDSILAMIEYNGKLIVGTRNFIYIVSSNEKPQVIYTYSRVYPEFMNIFKLNDKLYILDGITFKEFNGTTISNVQDNSYIPTLFISSNKDGSGSPLEQWNLLSDKFKQSFNGDGTASDLYLCFQYCDVLELYVDNVKIDRTKWNTTDQIVSPMRTKIFFLDGFVPTKGTDNIVAVCQLRRTNPIYTEKVIPCRDRINGCNLYSLYGGQNDTRLLLGGKDSVFYRSAVYNPYYFPENYYQSVGDNGEKITGFVTQYDYCVILKENSIWHTRFELLPDGTSAYITKPLNNQYGCINGKTIQLVQNSPIFLSKKGLSVVNQTQLRDERNVEVISYKINDLILKENFSKFCSIDFNNKYILGNNNVMYIYDYVYNCFYTWRIDFELFYITSFAEINGELYIGTGTGTIYKLRNETELEPTLNGAFPFDDEFKFNDNITKIPIKCTWKSKLFSFDDTNKYKIIEKLFLTTSVSEQTSCNISYITNRNTIVNVGTSFNNLFKYNYFDYSKFTYLSSVFPVTDKFKIKAKKILFYQLVLENSQPEETLDIYNIGIKFKYQKEVK